VAARGGGARGGERDRSHGTDSVGSESAAILERQSAAAETAGPELAAGNLFAGRFRIIGFLGSGGYGSVHRAEDLAGGRIVALKVLRADRERDSSARRIAREAMTSKRVSHPRLIRVFDADPEADRPWIAMEPIEGDSLRDLLRRGPLDVDGAVRIARDVLGALGALHAKGVIHRDVKPGNVMVGRDGIARLGDLGLVTAQEPGDTRETQTGALIGTVAYLSPEQALGRDVTPRSDIYALGITLFECLTGRLPHDRDSTLGTIVAHITQEAPAVVSFRRDCPRWLSSVVARMVERDPARRYASPDDALADIEARRATPAVPAPERILSRLRAPGIAAAGVIAALLSLAALWAQSGARPQGPGPPGPMMSAMVRSGVLSGMDATGRVLWSQALPGAGNDAGYARPSGHHLPERLRVTDLDGDGTNEILVVAAPEGQGKLYAFDARGRPRFEKTVGRPARYGGERLDTYGSGGTFEFREGGARRLFSVAMNVLSHASVLEEIDGEGRTLNEYWTPGHIVSANLVTFRGRRALAIGSYGNEFKGAALSIVDAERPSGHAPAAVARYRCESCPDGGPLAYLRFPGSDIVAAQTRGEGSAAVVFALTTETGGFNVNVAHGGATDESGAPHEAIVAYGLPNDLSRVDTIEPRFSLALAHDALQRRGLLDHAWGSGDVRALEDVRSWDGRAYVALPVRTR
jgi:hypothetical protein